MSIDPGLRAFWDQQQRQMTQNIRRYGVHLTYVSEEEGGCACCEAGVPAGPDVVAEIVAATDGDPSSLPERLSVPLCYTTGLFGVGHPELVVVGLSALPSMVLLNQVARRVFHDGQDVMAGEQLELEGLKVFVEELPDPWMTTFETFHYYDRPPCSALPTLQLTWADPQGRYPWDEGHVPVPWPQPRPGGYRA
ncbi:DUF4262 domain-containing protein [Ornithinimicrobium avium]|uniref:DUF4262 domain-containing protein n=1 Tax=Ornithinimicrobium avium TaxID=2283195 RepID=A0A345NNU5_9MICO|nr:DUF4262 domain-containing protein [Ornithinimicrobium avium]AXH96703.1 DUF4262 domain-containing protein [Ornithinimicrobium avium]